VIQALRSTTAGAGLEELVTPQFMRWLWVLGSQDTAGPALDFRVASGPWTLTQAPAWVARVLRALADHKRAVSRIGDASVESVARQHHQARVQLWDALQQLPSEARQPLFEELTGKPYRLEAFYPALFRLSELLAPHGLFLRLSQVLRGAYIAASQEASLTDAFAVYSVQRVNRQQTLTVWGRPVTYDRVVLGPAVVSDGEPLGFKGLEAVEAYRRAIIYSSWGWDIAVRNANALPDHMSDREIAEATRLEDPRAALDQLVRGADPLALALQVVQARLVRWGRARGRATLSAAIQRETELHEAGHFLDMRRPDYPLRFQHLPLTFQAQDAAIHVMKLDEERRAQRAAWREAEPLVSLWSSLGTAADPRARRLYHTPAYRAEFDAWISRIAASPERYGFTVNRDPAVLANPRTSIEHQLRAQLWRLALPEYRLLLRALTASLEGPAEELPAIRPLAMPSTGVPWAIVGPAVGVTTLAAAVGIVFGLRWRGQRIARNRAIADVARPLDDLLGRREARQWRDQLAMETWFQREVSEKAAAARHQALEALVSRLGTITLDRRPVRRQRQLEQMQAVAAGLRRLGERARWPATREVVAAQVRRLDAWLAQRQGPTAGPTSGLEEREQAQRLAVAVAAWREAALLVESGGRVRLTEAGFLLSDTLFVDVL